MKRWIVNATYLFLAVSLLGCATVTGPAVSKEEIEKASQELKVRNLDFQLTSLRRVNAIGDRLVAAIPSGDIKKDPRPFLGIECLQIDKYLRQLYRLSVEKGVLVAVVKDKSPAKAAGLAPGDVVLSINGRQIKAINQLLNAAARFKAGDIVRMEILKGTEKISVSPKIAQAPFDIPIRIVDLQEVNAATDGNSLFVTYGLLRFVKSEDEIAAVLAHEMAHALRGHAGKIQGTGIMGFIAALALGVVAEANAPGSGDLVMRGVGAISNIFTATYSRDLEREADYFAAKYVYCAGFDPECMATLFERFAIEIPASMIQSFLATHPSSPERMVRIRKIIEELKTGQPAKKSLDKGQ